MVNRRPQESEGAGGAGGTRRQASIQDVAAAASVSTATVSRVLNNPGVVAGETAQRVMRVIREMGYRPNPVAQTLSTRKSHVLGIALPDIYGEFYSELLRGADGEARRQGYHLLVSSEPRGPAAGAEAGGGGAGGAGGVGGAGGGGVAGGLMHGRLAFGLVDGLALMIAEPDESLVREACDLSLPVVVLDSEIDLPGIDSVLVDNASGAREAGLHLAERVDGGRGERVDGGRGERGGTGGRGGRCFFVGGPPENFDSRARAVAFVGALRDRGVEVGPETTAFDAYSVEWGARWARGAHGRGVLVGAGVLAGNDEIAYGVMLTAIDLGLKVPGEVKVVGFDDTRLASLVRPRLSTVRVPLAEVGAAAVRALVERIDNPGRARSVVRLSTSLVVRESSGGWVGEKTLGPRP